MKKQNRGAMLGSFFAAIIIALLSVPAFAQATDDSIPTLHTVGQHGDSFLRKELWHGNPKELIAIIHTYLQHDPTGTSLIDTTACGQAEKKSCASALAFVQAFQVGDAPYGLTDVSQLEDFLGKLVEVKPKAGAWYSMACLVPLKNGTFQVVTNCLSRQFKPGERAWADPKTRKIVLAEDCGNPVMAEEEPLVVEGSKCARVNYEVHDADKLQVIVAVKDGVDLTDEAACFGVSFDGGKTFEPLGENCPHTACRERRLEGMHAVYRDSWVFQRGQVVIFKVPVKFANPVLGDDYRLVGCLTQPSDRKSCGMLATQRTYRFVKNTDGLKIPTASFFYAEDRTRDTPPSVPWDFNHENCPEN